MTISMKQILSALSFILIAAFSLSAQNENQEIKEGNQMTGQSKKNFLLLTVTPPDAIVKIDGVTVKNTEGQCSQILQIGTHTCECSCQFYHTEKQSFTIFADKKTTLNIQLKPLYNYGYIKVNSTPEIGATVLINGQPVGTTPYTSEKMESKTYTVQVTKEKWHSEAKQVTVNDTLTTTVTLNMEPDFAEPVFACFDKEAEIWINGEQKGKGRWTGRIDAGTYTVEARKKSHITYTRIVSINSGDNRTFALAAPIPICGQIRVNATPFGADILLDGKKVGETPEQLTNVLIGEHKVEITKKGCLPITREVIVQEGETVEITAELPTGLYIKLNSEPSGASIYIDESYTGTAPFTKKLSYGKHNIKAEKNGIIVEKEITIREDGSDEWTLHVQKDISCDRTIRDYDGNTYNTVQIGKQCWMKENIRAEHGRDGTIIQLGSEPSFDTPSRYYPNNNLNNVSQYGYLYNWKAANKVCPPGWNLPTLEDWNTLTGYCWNYHDENLATTLAATSNWNYSSTNKSGFTALPAGIYDNGYEYFGKRAEFWTYSPSCVKQLDVRKVATIVTAGSIEDEGRSVRCIRD